MKSSFCILFLLLVMASMTLASPLSRFGSPGFAAGTADGRSTQELLIKRSPAEVNKSFGQTALQKSDPVIPLAQSGTVAAVAPAPQSVVWSTDAEIPRVLNVPFPVTFKIDKPYTEDMSFNVSSPDIQFQNCLVEVKKGFTTAVAMAQLLKPQLLPLETKKTATVQVRQISSSHTTVQAVPLALATVSDSPSQLSSIGSGSNITEFNGQPSHNIQHPGWYQAIKSELINLQVQFQPCGNSPHEQCLVELRVLVGGEGYRVTPSHYTRILVESLNTRFVDSTNFARIQPTFATLSVGNNVTDGRNISIGVAGRPLMVLTLFRHEVVKDHPYLTVLITVYQDAVTKTANGLCGQLSAADFQENKSPSIRKAPLDFIHALEQSRNVPYNAESSETTDYLQDWRIPDGIQIQFPVPAQRFGECSSLQAGVASTNGPNPSLAANHAPSNALGMTLHQDQNIGNSGTRAYGRADGGVVDAGTLKLPPKANAFIVNDSKQKADVKMHITDTPIRAGPVNAALANPLQVNIGGNLPNGNTQPLSPPVALQPMGVGQPPPPAVLPPMLVGQFSAPPPLLVTTRPTAPQTAVHPAKSADSTHAVIVPPLGQANAGGLTINIADGTAATSPGAAEIVGTNAASGPRSPATDTIASVQVSQQGLKTDGVHSPSGTSNADINPANQSGVPQDGSITGGKPGDKSGGVGAVLKGAAQINTQSIAVGTAGEQPGDPTPGATVTQAISQPNPSTGGVKAVNQPLDAHINSDSITLSNKGATRNSDTTTNQANNPAVDTSMGTTRVKEDRIIAKPIDTLAVHAAKDGLPAPMGFLPATQEDIPVTEDTRPVTPDTPNLPSPSIVNSPKLNGNAYATHTQATSEYTAGNTVSIIGDDKSDSTSTGVNASPDERPSDVVDINAAKIPAPDKGVNKGETTVDTAGGTSIQPTGSVVNSATGNQGSYKVGAAAVKHGVDADSSPATATPGGSADAPAAGHARSPARSYEIGPGSGSQTKVVDVAHRAVLMSPGLMGPQKPSKFGSLSFLGGHNSLKPAVAGTTEYAKPPDVKSCLASLSMKNKCVELQLGDRTVLRCVVDIPVDRKEPHC